MIRCVKVTGIFIDPDYCPYFGFWDTVRDRFLGIGDHQTLFRSRADFEELVQMIPRVDGRGGPDAVAMIERCRRLIPDWVPAEDPLEDD